MADRGVILDAPPSEESRQDGGEGGIRTHVPAFGRQDAFEAPPL
jgi:hypothetical protein